MVANAKSESQVDIPAAGRLPRAESARINGSKSRGPISAEGKARSSRNSLKHGLLAKKVAPLFSESGEWTDYHAHLTELKSEFQPQTRSEMSAVELLAGEYVMLGRLRQMLENVMMNVVPNTYERPAVSSDDAKAARDVYAMAVNALRGGDAIKLDVKEQVELAKAINQLRQPGVNFDEEAAAAPEHRQPPPAFEDVARVRAILRGEQTVHAEHKQACDDLVIGQHRSAIKAASQAAIDEQQHEKILRSSMDAADVDWATVERITNFQSRTQRSIDHILQRLRAGQQ